jgi:GT2 family glycosyltransferase
MYPSSFTSLIVTYNSADEVLNLLADLHAHVPTHRIIIVDNASKDETACVVQKHFPQVELIRNATNVGYAKAVNQGFDLCDTEYVLLLNPDIRITSPQLLSDMQEHLNRFRQIAAVAPLQFKNDKKKHSLTFTWSHVTPKTFKLYLSFLLRRKQGFPEPLRVTFLNAGCLLIRGSAFEQVGKLNEKYFLYGEEPDLFLKFRRYGFECYLLPKSAVTHYRERSLMTVPVWTRLQIRFRAVWNVLDALINGWARILLDKLAANKPGSVPQKGKFAAKKNLSGNLS